MLTPVVVHYFRKYTFIFAIFSIFSEDKSSEIDLFSYRKLVTRILVTAFYSWILCIYNVNCEVGDAFKFCSMYKWHKKASANF